MMFFVENKLNMEVASGKDEFSIAVFDKQRVNHFFLTRLQHQCETVWHIFGAGQAVLRSIVGLCDVRSVRISRI